MLPALTATISRMDELVRLIDKGRLERILREYKNKYEEEIEDGSE